MIRVARSFAILVAESNVMVKKLETTKETVISFALPSDRQSVLRSAAV